MTTPKITYFTHFNRSGNTRPASEVYDELIRDVVASEEQGWDGVWFAQHHLDRLGSRDCFSASPLSVISALSGHTSRIELGIATQLISFDDPLRLAEDAATVDALVRGRLKLGLGTGGIDTEAGVYPAFGLRYSDRREIFDTKVAQLRRILAGETLIDGKQALRLAPSGEALRKKLFLSAGTLDRAVEVGRSGDLYLQGTFFDHPNDLPKITAYRDNWRAVPSGPASPYVGLFRFVHIGESRQEVLDRLSTLIDLSAPMYQKSARVPGYSSLTDFLDKSSIWGSPSDVLEGLRQDPVLSRGLAQELIVCLDENSPVEGDFARHVELFAREVVPHLREPVRARESASEERVLVT